MNKSSLFGLAVIFGLLGIGGIYLSARVVCLLNQCLLITEGDNMFNAKGITIDPGTSKIIQTSPVILFSIAGASLVAGLVKQSNQ